MVRRNQPAGDQVSMMQTSPGAAGMPAAIRGSASTNVSQLEELMRRKGVDEAWDALEDMQRQGLTTDRFTISRMLMKTVADSRGRWNPAKVYRSIALVENFIQMQPTEADEVLFNALLDTHSRMKDLPRLQVTMQQMKDLRIQPSHVTLGILVKAYGQACDIKRVLKVWDEMVEQRNQANAVTYGCMINACVKCGHIEKAVEIFRDMKKKRKHRNTILYTTLIKGYGNDKDLRNALSLFREMKEEGVPCNTITYNSIIDVCIKCSDVQTAEELMREMVASGGDVQPDLITYSTLLKGYCQVGDLDKALQVADTIKACGLKCDELVYNTLIDGCVKANDLSAGVGLFAEMTQAGMKPSSITHSIFLRLYQRNGYKTNASDAVAQLYQHHGLERPPENADRGAKNTGGGRRGEKHRAQAPGAAPGGNNWTANNSSVGARPSSGAIGHNGGSAVENNMGGDDMNGTWGCSSCLAGSDAVSCLGKHGRDDQLHSSPHDDAFLQSRAGFPHVALPPVQPPGSHFGHAVRQPPTPIGPHRSLLADRDDGTFGAHSSASMPYLPIEASHGQMPGSMQQLSVMGGPPTEPPLYSMAPPVDGLGIDRLGGMYMQQAQQRCFDHSLEGRGGQIGNLGLVPGQEQNSDYAQYGMVPWGFHCGMSGPSMGVPQSKPPVSPPHLCALGVGPDAPSMHVPPHNMSVAGPAMPMGSSSIHMSHPSMQLGGPSMQVSGPSMHGPSMQVGGPTMPVNGPPMQVLPVGFGRPNAGTYQGGRSPDHPPPGTFDAMPPSLHGSPWDPHDSPYPPPLGRMECPLPLGPVGSGQEACPDRTPPEGRPPPGVRCGGPDLHPARFCLLGASAGHSL